MVRYDELALNYMTTLVTDPRLLLLPATIWAIVGWRLGKQRGYTLENYRARVEEQLEDTIEEQLGSNLRDLIEQAGLPRPTSTQTDTIVNTLVEPVPDRLWAVSQIHIEMTTHLAASEYLARAVEIFTHILGGG